MPFNLQNNALKPAPIAIHTKVLMVGGENLYEVLYNNDRDFQKYFKVSAEFDSEMELNDENVKQYMGFISMIVEDEDLLSPDTEGYPRNCTVRCTPCGNIGNKLSTRFSFGFADLLRGNLSYLGRRKGWTKKRWFPGGLRSREKALWR